MPYFMTFRAIFSQKQNMDSKFFLFPETVLSRNALVVVMIMIAQSTISSIISWQATLPTSHRNHCYKYLIHRLMSARDRYKVCEWGGHDGVEVGKRKDGWVWGIEQYKYRATESICPPAIQPSSQPTVWPAVHLSVLPFPPNMSVEDAVTKVS